MLKKNLTKKMFCLKIFILMFLGFLSCDEIEKVKTKKTVKEIGLGKYNDGFPVNYQDGVWGFDLLNHYKAKSILKKGKSKVGLDDLFKTNLMFKNPKLIDFVIEKDTLLSYSGLELKKIAPESFMKLRSSLMRSNLVVTVFKDGDYVHKNPVIIKHFKYNIEANYGAIVTIWVGKIEDKIIYLNTNRMF